MDKVQKIREEVAKLKSQLLRGACSSQVAMETCCKEEAYNEVLGILDTMQEEPTTSVWHDASEKQPITGSSVLVIKGHNYEVLYSVLKVYPGEGRKWAYIEDLIKL